MAFAKCNSCRRGIPLHQFHSLPSKVLVSYADRLDAKKRKYILSLTAQAYRNVCKDCKIFEEKFDAEHCKLQNGVVMQCDSSEWMAFCNEYSDIAEGEGFGVCIDRYGGKLCYKDVKDEEFVFGESKNISVWKYFDKLEKEIHKSLTSPSPSPKTLPLPKL